MLLSARKLEHFTLRAFDGEIGKVHDFLFEDNQWLLRYMVADTRRWLPGRQVLIAPASLGEPELTNRDLPVSLSIDQLRNSPGIETDRPVSRQLEGDLSTYYGWPMYWYGPSAIGAGAMPEPMSGLPIPGAMGHATDPYRMEPASASASATATIEPETGDPHLRSMRELVGYRIAATDGDIGHLDDFLLETKSWAVRYLVVDIRNWLPGRKVLVAPPWISRFVWEKAKVHVDLPRELIRTAPEFDPNAPVAREYEDALHRHYDRDRYWDDF